MSYRGQEEAHMKISRTLLEVRENFREWYINGGLELRDYIELQKEYYTLSEAHVLSARKAERKKLIEMASNQ